MKIVSTGISSKIDGRLARLFDDERVDKDLRDIPVLIRVAHGTDAKQALDKIGVEVHSVIATICTARVSVNDLNRLAAEDWVVRIEGSRPVYPEKK